jgi:hypothetical protein
MNRKTPPNSPPPVADHGQASKPEEPTGHYGPGYGDPTRVDPSKEPEPRPDPNPSSRRNSEST